MGTTKMQVRARRPAKRLPYAYGLGLVIGLGFLLGLGGCGAASSAREPAEQAPGGLQLFLPIVPIQGAEAAAFIIRLSDLPQTSGGVLVHFRAESGTPFFDGTAAAFSAGALIDAPTQIRGQLPALLIPHTLPGPIRARVSVELASGQILAPTTLEALFAPLAPPQPPTVAGVSPGLLLAGAPTCFHVQGSGFKPIGGAATVDFVANSGTPFEDGTSDTLRIAATIESDTVIQGVLPALSVPHDIDAFVTVHLPGGVQATSLLALARLGSERRVVAADALARDNFGAAVALSNDTAVIGARLQDELGTSAGVAYVFVRQGDQWVQQQKLLAPDGAAGDQFGSAVAIDGDTIAIGSPNHDSAASNGGAVYVFVRSATLWSLEQKLTASDASSGDHLGEAVALYGHVIGGGAPDENNAGGTDAGAVYVFSRVAGLWSEQQKLMSALVEANDHFGQAVALSAGHLLVGAPDGDKALVYAPTGPATWGEEQDLLAPGVAAGHDYGRSLDISGDLLIVGAPSAGGIAATSGSAHVFQRTAGPWIHEQVLLGTGGGSADKFGWSVALAGGLALVGAPTADLLASNAGAAWPFERTPAGTWSGAPALTASDGASSDRFGQAVDLAGCNTIIGAHLANAPATDTGAAYLK